MYTFRFEYHFIVLFLPFYQDSMFATVTLLIRFLCEGLHFTEMLEALA